MRKTGNENTGEKHKAGINVSKKEQSLITNADNSELENEEWSAFVKQNKRKIPENLNKKLWDSFQNRIIRRRRLRIGIMSAAASIILLISITIGHSKQQTSDYSNEEALLNLALEMCSIEEQPSIQKHIIYEDELIVIYTTLDN